MASNYKALFDKVTLVAIKERMCPYSHIITQYQTGMYYDIDIVVYHENGKFYRSLIFDNNADVIDIVKWEEITDTIEISTYNRMVISDRKIENAILRVKDDTSIKKDVLLPDIVIYYYTTNIAFETTIFYIGHLLECDMLNGNRLRNINTTGMITGGSDGQVSTSIDVSLSKNIGYQEYASTIFGKEVLVRINKMPPPFRTLDNPRDNYLQR